MVERWGSIINKRAKLIRQRFLSIMIAVALLSSIFLVLSNNTVSVNAEAQEKVIMREANYGLQRAAKKYFGSWNEAKRAVGLEIGVNKYNNHYSLKFNHNRPSLKGGGQLEDVILCHLEGVKNEKR